MNDKKQIVVGLFVLAGLVLLGTMIVWFGRMAVLVRGTYIVSGHLPSAMGVRSGRRVHLDGIEIGEVRDVTTSQPERPGVWANLRINPGFSIPQDATFVALESALGGDPFLDFQSPVKPNAEPVFLPKDDTARVDGVVRSPSLLPPDLVKRFDSLAADFHDGMAQLKGLGALTANVKELTDPRTLDEVKAGKRPNLSSALAQFQSTAKSLQNEVDDPKSDLNRLLETARASSERLSGTLKEVDATLGSVRNTADTYTKAAVSLETTSAKATALLEQFTKDEKDLAGQLRKVLDDVQAGKGTLGQLVTSDELHRELVHLIETLQATTDTVNRLMTMWRQEGILAKEK